MEAGEKSVKSRRLNFFLRIRFRQKLLTLDIVLIAIDSLYFLHCAYRWCALLSLHDRVWFLILARRCNVISWRVHCPILVTKVFFEYFNVYEFFIFFWTIMYNWKRCWILITILKLLWNVILLDILVLGCIILFFNFIQFWIVALCY